MLLKIKEMGSGYAWSKSYLVINSGDTVKWSWSAPNLVTGVTYQIQQVADAASQNPTGFSSGSSSASGK